MKALLTIATVLFAQQVLAGNSIHLVATGSATTVYSALSDTRYQGIENSGSATAKIYGNIGGQDISVENTQPVTNDGVEKLKFDIVSSSRVRVYSEDGQSISLPATFSKDGSFVIKSSDMKKQVEVKVKEKIAELKQTMTGEVSFSFDASDLVCKKGGSEYTCTSKMKMKIGLVQD